jgi:hypothetical protein
MKKNNLITAIVILAIAAGLFIYVQNKNASCPCPDCPNDCTDGKCTPPKIELLVHGDLNPLKKDDKNPGLPSLLEIKLPDSMGKFFARADAAVAKIEGTSGDITNKLWWAPFSIGALVGVVGALLLIEISRNQHTNEQK